jgi:antitoxin component of RelBE/YafQ-DinJ toxin-antitoxin module
MTTDLRRVALLLAASDLSEKQLSSVIRELGRLPPELLVRFVRRLRTINDVVLELDEPLRTKKALVRETTVGKLDVVLKIDDLLRREAGMTVSEAMSALGDSLAREKGIPESVRAAEPKTGTLQFHRWIGRILEYVPASTLLHFATAIRNRHVQTSITDWPLKEGPD